MTITTKYNIGDRIRYRAQTREGAQPYEATICGIETMTYHPDKDAEPHTSVIYKLCSNGYQFGMINELNVIEKLNN